MDWNSIHVEFLILISCLGAMIMKKKFPRTAVILVCGVVLLTMVYRTYYVPSDINTCLTKVLIIGFTISILLKSRLMAICHLFSLLIIISIFTIGIKSSILKPDEFLNYAITYMVLYAMLTFAASTLKLHYDKLHQNVELVNLELKNQALEIKNQNEELIQMQNNLHDLNNDLELRINEKTEVLKIKTKKLIEYNEKILKYTYYNAHHLRGPVARLLGLIIISKMDNNLSREFIMDRIEGSALEIDTVVKKINLELSDPEFFYE